MATCIILCDADDGIEILKSGAPHPSDEMLDWLAATCRGDWCFACDNAFNVLFRFGLAEDARLFTARWGGRSGDAA